MFDVTALGEMLIDFTMQGQPDSYEGRQDFGDGDGSLIQHIRGYRILRTG